MRSHDPDPTGSTRLRTFLRITGENWLAGQRLVTVLKALGHDETGPVLDAGCGDSPFRVFFPRAHLYIRLDRAGTSPLDVTASLPDIPIQAASVSVILLLHVLADLPEPQLALAEARRVLRPGGRIVVLETTCYPQHDLPHDYYRILPGALRYLAEQSGLRVASIEYLGGIFTRFASLNAYVLSLLRQYVLLRPFVGMATACSNIVFLLADMAVPRPALAESYCAVLVAADEQSPFGAVQHAHDYSAQI